MNKSINGDYIEYRMFFIISAYYQQINENLIKLFIKSNKRIYFPEFILYKNFTNQPNTVLMDLGEIDEIVEGVLYLNYCKKDNETKS